MSVSVILGISIEYRPEIWGFVRFFVRRYSTISLSFNRYVGHVSFDGSETGREGGRK